MPLRCRRHAPHRQGIGTTRVPAGSLPEWLVADTIASYEYAADWHAHFARVDSRRE